VTAAEWFAVYAGAPTFIAAVTALIIALRGNSTAKATQALMIAHVTRPGQHQEPKP
jgi:hypothetical protein